MDKYELFIIIEHLTMIFGVIVINYLDDYFNKSKLKEIDFNKAKSYPPNSTISRPTGNDSQKIGIRDNIALSLSFPSFVKSLEEIVINFAAYPETLEDQLKNLLSEMTPKDKIITGVDYCKWIKGTEIKVRLHSEYLKVAVPIQVFIWENRIKILPFDVIVKEIPSDVTSFYFSVDVMIADIVVSKLRAQLLCNAEKTANGFVVGRPYESAFVSYSSKDIKYVRGRVSEIERNGVKIFFDKATMHTGKNWRLQLRNAIIEHEMFLLFWSVNASQSKEVKWEWKTALKHKGIDAIQPHPLESPKKAPPPKELAKLHFDDKYLYFD